MIIDKSRSQTMQQNFTDIEYSCRKKETRRDKFLNKMDKMVPWADWIAMIEPFYPSGRRGRPTRGIEIILRMYHNVRGN